MMPFSVNERKKARRSAHFTKRAGSKWAVSAKVVGTQLRRANAALATQQCHEHASLNVNERASQ